MILLYLVCSKEFMGEDGFRENIFGRNADKNFKKSE
jgi:hypothetical protein